MTASIDRVERSLLLEVSGEVLEANGPHFNLLSPNPGAQLTHLFNAHMIPVWILAPARDRKTRRTEPWE